MFLRVRGVRIGSGERGDRIKCIYFLRVRVGRGRAGIRLNA